MSDGKSWKTLLIYGAVSIGSVIGGAWLFSKLVRESSGRDEIEDRLDELEDKLNSTQKNVTEIQALPANSINELEGHGKLQNDTRDINAMVRSWEEITAFSNAKKALDGGIDKYPHGLTETFVTANQHIPFDTEILRSALQKAGLQDFNVSYNSITKNEAGLPTYVLHDVFVKWGDDSVNKEEIKNIVKSTLQSMGLQQAAGNWISSVGHEGMEPAAFRG